MTLQTAPWDRNGPLWDVCSRFGDALTGKVTHESHPVNGPALLWAIAGTESTFGRDRLYARRERAYAPPRGKYYTDQVRALYQQYGDLVPCSYGSFQVLYVTAWELGFRRHPIALQDEATCAQWAVTYIEQRALKRGATTLADVLDAYNSGTHRDRIVPARYIADTIGHYRETVGPHGGVG